MNIIDLVYVYTVYISLCMYMCEVSRRGIVARGHAGCDLIVPARDWLAACLTDLCVLSMG